MRLFASGVTIIATAHAGQRSGLTATAVCSLALAPPRILACVNLGGYTYKLLSHSRCMSVNILAEDQRAVADRFSGRAGEGDAEDRFAGARWQTCATGAPVLADALVGLDCTIAQMSVLDTHSIIIGAVEHVTFGPLRPPLLRFDSAFMMIPFSAEPASAKELAGRNLPA